MLGNSVSFRVTRVGGALLAAAAIACSDSLTPQQRDIDALRQAVEPYRVLATAQQAGYDVVVGDPTDGHTCLSDPHLGAMGVHYLNPALVDDTVIATKPEIMIYEPQQDGSMEFVAVEYIIPYSIRGADQPAPTLFGVAFQKNETFQLWGLHVWVGRNNPSGLFAMWNPDVTCQYGH